MGLMRKVEIKGKELRKGRGIKENNEIKCVCLFVVMIAFILIY